MWEGAWTAQLVSQKGSVVIEESLRWRYGGLRSLPLMLGTMRQLGLRKVTVFWPLRYRKLEAMRGIFELNDTEIMGASRRELPPSSAYVVYGRQVDEERSQYLSQLATMTYDAKIPTLFIIDSEDTVLSSGPKLMEKYGFTAVTYKQIWERNVENGFVKPTVLRSQNLAFHKIAGLLRAQNIPLNDLFSDPRLTTKLPWSHQLDQVRMELEQHGVKMYEAFNPWIDVADVLMNLGATDLFGRKRGT